MILPFRSVALAAIFVVSAAAAADTDPLPSWKDGPTKQAIVGFVKKVTEEGSPDYVRPEDRIATFDNDGNLWAEQPVYFSASLRHRPG
jgi:hypothetical protein